MSSEKSSGFFIKINLAIFYGLNFPFELLKELWRRISGQSGSKKEKNVSKSELDDYNKLFLIILLIPVIYIIVLLFIRSNRWFYAIIIFLSVQTISLTILSLKSSYFYYYNANIFKIEEEFENIYFFTILDLFVNSIFLILISLDLIILELSLIHI